MSIPRSVARSLAVDRGLSRRLSLRTVGLAMPIVWLLGGLGSGFVFGQASGEFGGLIWTVLLVPTLLIYLAAKRRLPD